MTKKSNPSARSAKPSKSREIILDILLEILERGSYSHVVLRQALSKYQYLEKQDRAFITRVSEGTIEYRLAVDAVLGQCSSVRVPKMKPVIRTILRMSVYQILYMDRIPDSAVCDEAVRLAVSRRFQGLKGFVNGVLRTVARQKDSFVFTDWTLKYSMPGWLINRLKSEYGEPATERMLDFFLQDAPTTVRCNLDRATGREIRQSLEIQGVSAADSPLLPGMLLLSGYDYLEALDAFRRGWIQVQDVGSALVGEAADPQPGEMVIDVCGAPGGKSLHIADKLKGSGLVLVRDLTEAKIRMVEENIARTGFTNMRAEVWDARIPDPRYESKADLVIADLPCSGLGVIGRKPEIKYQVTEERIASLAALQREILAVSGRYVRPGGRLIYSTCTLGHEENEDQRDWFLAHFPFRPIPLNGLLGEGIREATLREGYVRLLPGTYPCDGFFIAAFEREE